MRRHSLVFVLAFLIFGVAGQVLAAPATGAPSAGLSVLDVLRTVPAAEASAVITDPCQDQICHYVDATAGNPAHYNCATQTNSKCIPADPPTTCGNGICRKPAPTTGGVEAGGL